MKPKKKGLNLNSEETESISSTIYPADILTVPDSNDAVYGHRREDSGPHAVYLSLPNESCLWFTECERPVAMDCSVFQTKADFLIAFIVLQAESLQARVVVPVCDEKSRTWLAQCITQSSVSCFLSAQGASRYRRYDAKLVFSHDDTVLTETGRPSRASAWEVLLAIASSLPDLSRVASVPSYTPGVAVDKVNLCIVRDFFNTDDCAQAMKELLPARL